MEFEAIAIVGGHDGESTDFVAPCGVCPAGHDGILPAPDFKIILAKSQADYKEYTLEELLPSGLLNCDLTGYLFNDLQTKP